MIKYTVLSEYKRHDIHKIMPIMTVESLVVERTYVLELKDWFYSFKL